MKTKGIAYFCSGPAGDSRYKQWSVKLVIDKEEAKKLEAVGLKITKEVIEIDGEDKVVLTRRFSRNFINKKTGEKNPTPLFVDAAKNPFTGEECGIGNGSEVIILHKPFKYNNAEYGSGISSDLKGVQILNLIPFEYKSNEDDLDDGDDEFEVVGEGLVDEEDTFEEESSKDIPY